jgi:hypothetical protein
MDKNLERIERYLQGVNVPEHAPGPHREQLRRRILEKIAERQVGPARHITWKVVTAAAGLVCIGGLIAGVFGLKNRGDARPIGESPAYVLTSGVLDINDIGNVRQAVKAARDSNAPPLENDVELVQVIESEVNGRLIDRTLVQKCILSTGQTKAGTQGQQTPVPLAATAWQEIGQLRRTGKGENLGTQERQMKGLVFVFKRERYTLHDGTTVTLSVGEPKDGNQPPTRAAAENSPQEE